MSLSEKAIKEFQEIYRKKYGRELSYEEAADAARRLVGLVEICYDSWREDQKRKKKLEEFPKGFHLDGVGYTCFICGNRTPAGGNWYDKYGIKCLICQKAIDKKIIPATATHNKDSWYSKYDLESCFNLDRHALNRFVKQGILKPRTVPGESGRPHVQIFLIKDNKDTLPPKKLTESHMVKETKDGKDWYHSEPWYKFVDPKEHLRGYKIMDYLKIVHEKTEKVEKEIKKEPMKIKEIFKLGGIMQAIGGTAVYLDQNNCVIRNKSKTDDAVILHLKRDSDGEEGNVYLRVRDEFKSIKDPLLNWAFANNSMVGLTLNQLENQDTNLDIQKSGGKLSLHQG